MVSKGSRGGRKAAAGAAAPSADPSASGPVGTMTTGATVVRFTPGAAKQGMKQLGEAGMRVASARELADAAPEAGAVAADFGGANVLYFERFGIAIMQEEPARIRGALAKATADRVVANARPERVYRALGLPSSAPGAGPRAGGAAGEGGRLTPDYLRGYRDAVDQLVDRLLGGEAGGPEAAAAAAARLQDTDATWGLAATGVTRSCFSGAGIKVAVLDTGMDLDHPDFAARQIVSKSFIPNEDVQDMQGHGTHCIGTACGPREPTGQPRYGVAHGATICAGKVLSNEGFGTDRSIIAGMEWALDEGAAVISMSLGSEVQPGEGWLEDYEVIGNVCLDAGTLVVAAAGNESRRPTRIAPVGAPANTPSMMAVAALTPELQVAWFSCGAINPGQAVDISGPGVDVLSSVPDGHGFKDGTSMATPHVSGIAALYAESDAKFRGRALWAILMQRARRLTLPARDVGMGLVQAP